MSVSLGTGPRRARRSLLVLVLLAGACSTTSPDKSGRDLAASSPVRSPDSNRTQALPIAGPPPPAASGASGSISGRAPQFTDDVPAIVVLEPSQRFSYPLPAERPMMDQIATRFTPAAMVVRTGAPADFRNDDDKLHNVRVRERGQAADELVFNIALGQGVSFDYTFTKDAAWDVRCDVHHNMYGLVVSTSSPYAAVATADGTFAIDHLPAGDYRAIAYTSRDRRERAIHLDQGQHLTLTQW